MEESVLKISRMERNFRVKEIVKDFSGRPPGCVWSYWSFPDDGDLTVADEPPVGVVQSGLESHFLPDQDPDAEHSQQTG